MTRAFLDEELNAGIGPEPARAEIARLADRLCRLPYESDPRSALKHLRYNGLEAMIKARFVFQERKWHATRYPRPEVDASKCIGCGACARSCPVNRFAMTSEGKASVGEASCIHCMNCAVECPAQAIRLVGDMEKGRALLAHMIEHHANRELPATAAYPLGRSGTNGSIKRRAAGAMIAALDSPRRLERCDPVGLLKSAGLEDGRNVVELGCGSGFFKIGRASCRERV